MHETIKTAKQAKQVVAKNLDMDHLLRYFRNTGIHTPEDAETVRDSAAEVLQNLRDLLYELSGLENELVDGLLEHYEVVL